MPKPRMSIEVTAAWCRKILHRDADLLHQQPGGVRAVRGDIVRRSR
jgi:hypothetical protein